MKITFISNYLNHHQLPFCYAMLKLCDGDFHFVSMENMSSERIKMGWGLSESFDFEIKAKESAESQKTVKALIEDSDIVIFGGNAYAPKIHNRIIKNKLTFLYSERVYKNGIWRVISPRGQYYMRRDNTRYKNNNLFLLAASAYAPFDYSLVGAYKNKAYKWGYFPQTKKYDIDSLIKQKEPMSILWTARFIEWKHPEKALKVAKKLKKHGYNFKLRLIGNGILEEKMKNLAKKYDVEDRVEFLGSMSPEQVREHMEKSQVFLFTSDKGEGWGAVLNEAMNSGCAVIADKYIGAAPYLIKNGKNGFLYGGSVSQLYKRTKLLLEDSEKRSQFGKNAYKTITEEWNAETAAERFITLSEHLMSGKEPPFTSGPCSKPKLK